jgi:FtsZ-interacting cell division protein ZipA
MLDFIKKRLQPKNNREWGLVAGVVVVGVIVLIWGLPLIMSVLSWIVGALIVGGLGLGAYWLLRSRMNKDSATTAADTTAQTSSTSRAAQTIRDTDAQINTISGETRAATAQIEQRAKPAAKPLTYLADYEARKASIASAPPAANVQAADVAPAKPAADVQAVPATTASVAPADDVQSTAAPAADDSTRYMIGDQDVSAQVQAMKARLARLQEDTTPVQPFDNADDAAAADDAQDKRQARG